MPRVLLLEHGLALVGDEQVVHVVRVLFLLGQDALYHHSRRRVFVAEVAHHVTIRLDGDALGDQVLLDHIHQVLPFDVLRRRAGGQTFGMQIGRASELSDPLGQEVEVFPLLLRVLSELLKDSLDR